MSGLGAAEKPDWVARFAWRAAEKGDRAATCLAQPRCTAEVGMCVGAKKTGLEAVRLRGLFLKDSGNHLLSRL